MRASIKVAALVVLLLGTSQLLTTSATDSKELTKRIEVQLPCGAVLPNPPIIFYTPEGVAIGSAGADYHLATRTVQIIGVPSIIFCDSFENERK